MRVAAVPRSWRPWGDTASPLGRDVHMSSATQNARRQPPCKGDFYTSRRACTLLYVVHNHTFCVLYTGLLYPR